MRVQSILLAAAILVSPVAVLFGDVVHLKDGTSINGDIKKAADGWFITDPHGKITHVSSDVVQSIELAPKGDPKDVAVGRLASLRRSVEALGDLKQIIDRFEKFVEQNKELPIAAEAR